MKKENSFLNLIFNIILPSVILIWGNKFFKSFAGTFSEQQISIAIFLVAISLPLAYGIYDLASRKKWNIFSIIGIISVLLTGGIGLLHIDTTWMIVKETAIPLVLGVAVLVSAFTKKPLAKILIFNENLLDLEKVNQALDENNTRDKFEKDLLFATYLLALSFLVSAILNFLLAYNIFKSPSGTPEFNEEVGRMTALSWPVIVIPTSIILIFAIYKVFNAITRYTGLKFEDLLSEQLKNK